MAKDTKEPKDQRAIDREAELAKQKDVTDALDKFYEDSRKEAEKALQDQRDKEKGVHGITTVDSKS